MRGFALALVLLAACGPSEGTVDALTYNVAGLPEGLSKSNPERNHLTIGGRLNAYDLVMVQEDFAYHDRLGAAAQHPFRSTPKETTALIADGLNRFSAFELGTLERVEWAACNGTLDSSNDCLAEKGFSVGTVLLDDGVEIDVFNLHMDAGGGEDDDAARAVQISQWVAAIEARPGRAILVAGDTNLHRRDVLDVPRLDGIEEVVTDSCAALSCGDDRIDRFYLRSGDDVQIIPERWWLPGEFVDDAGEPLSDHEPVALRFRWRRL